MSRPYLTVKGFSLKYHVPQSTVKQWIREGTLKARTDIRPMQIPDDQGIPYKDPSVHGWRYQWRKDR